MATSTNTIYVGSDELVTLTGLVDNTDSSYINNATVTMSLYEDEIITPDAAAIVDKGAGAVGIPITGTTLAAGDKIMFLGSENYEGEFTIQSKTTDEIVITATYVAETLEGVEEIYKNVEGAYQLAVAYIGASDGNYQGTLPDILRLVAGDWYYLFVDIEDTGNFKKLIRKKVKAAYAGT